MSSLRLGVLSAVIVVALASGFAFWRAYVGDPVTGAIENRLVDLRFRLRGAEKPPGNVVLVGIDAAAVDKLGWNPPPRAEFAKAIQIVAAAEPSVIGLDMLFLDQTDADEDLARAVSGPAPTVVAIAARHDGAPLSAVDFPRETLEESAVSIVVGSGSDPSMIPPRLYLPVERIAEVGLLGHVNLSRADDLLARNVPLTMWIGDNWYVPAMALTAARLHQNLPQGSVRLVPGRQVSFGDRVLPTDRTGRVPIKHYGAAGTIRTVGLLDVVNGRVPSEVFTGRIVIFGITDPSFSDVFATPFGADVPGAEVIATVAENLVADDLLLQVGAAGMIGILLAPLIGLGFVLAVWAPLSTLWIVMLWVGSLAVLQYAFVGLGYLVDATTILVALVLGSAAALRVRSIRHRARRQVLETERSNLSRYVSPVLADELAAHGTPDFDKRTQAAAVLFADVAGFTGIAELLGPNASSSFVKQLHRTFEDCVEAHGGVIISFEGDGVMVGFGLPRPEPEDATRALTCGRAMIDAVGKLQTPLDDDQPIRLRVSVNYGPVVTAVVGGDRQAHVTMSGDTVNVASRLQEIAKAQGVNFVAARSVLDAAFDHEAEAAGWRFLVETPVRGRDARLEVWAA